jgi:hypothetical protein
MWFWAPLISKYFCTSHSHFSPMSWERKHFPQTTFKETELRLQEVLWKHLTEGIQHSLSSLCGFWADRRIWWASGELTWTCFYMASFSGNLLKWIKFEHLTWSDYFHNSVLKGLCHSPVVAITFITADFICFFIVFINNYSFKVIIYFNMDLPPPILVLASSSCGSLRNSSRMWANGIYTVSCVLY